MPSRLIRYAPLIVGLLAPFLTLLLFPRTISWDIQSFRYWAHCLNTFTGPPYPDCFPELINYPTVGLYAATSVVHLMELLGLNEFQQGRYFQVYLGFIDALNVLLMYLLLRGLRIPHASWATLFFAILPSTRVGGNLWGQIDGVSQFFLSLGVLCGLRALRAIQIDRLKKALRYLTVLSLALVCALLTKQLVIFSLPALAFLWVVGAFKLTKQGKGPKVALVTFVSLCTLIALDRLFPTPPNYLGSGLNYVLITGSKHAERVLHNGVSLFALLPIPDTGASKDTYQLFDIWRIKVSIKPFYFGLGLFLAALTALIALGARTIRARKLYSSFDITIASLVLSAACNLFMNLALTGTHERYLYHYGFFAYPAVLALSHCARFPKTLIALTLVHLFCYGIYVYQVLLQRFTDQMTQVFLEATVIGNIIVSLLLLYLLARAATTREVRSSDSR